MHRCLRSIHRILTLFGLDVSRALLTIRHLPSYFADLRRIKRQKGESLRSFPFGKLTPCLGEGTMDCGSAKGAYFHQDLLVARRIHERQPDRHIDVGSRIDGFVAHVASFREIDVVDIRPMMNNIPGVRFLQADLMSVVPETLVEATDSLSCLHTIEHFGLGRYGDRLDADGHLVGLDNLLTILRPGGTLYLSVPIGPQRIEFNAHRVFSIQYLMQMLEGRCTTKSFSYVDDQGDLHRDVALSHESIANNFGCTLGCGIFELVKS